MSTAGSEHLLKCFCATGLVKLTADRCESIGSRYGSLMLGLLISRAASLAASSLCCLGPVILFAQTTSAAIAGVGSLPPTHTTVSLMDAVSAAILKDSSLKLAALDLEASRARVGRALGAFDTRITTQMQEAHTYYPLTNYQHDLALTAGINTFSETLNYTSLQVSGQKLLQSGIEFLPHYTMSRAADNLENLGGVNRTNVDFEVLFPLLRGRGRAFTTAPLQAARLDVESKLAQQKETAAETVYATVIAYWRYVAAEQRLQQRQAQLARSLRLNESIVTLIQADRLPAARVHETTAALDNEEATVTAARQALLEARQALGDAMAFAPLDSMLLGAPSDALPDPPDVANDPEPAKLIAVALQHRLEIAVSHTRLEEAELDKKTAANGLRSRLDLTARSGYTGLALGTNVDRYFDSAANRVQGADIQGSVTYTWDFANQEAKAKLAEAQISGKRAQEADAAMNRSIGSEVITAMGELQASRGALAQAGLAQAGLQQVRSDAQDRLSGGEGVINDVLTAESDLSNAELATIEARTRYALAVARLRYVTGTLLGYDPGHPSLERSNLVTPPQP